MHRRDFVKLASAGTAAVVFVPPTILSGSAPGRTGEAAARDVALAAVDQARSLGADYADCRVTRLSVQRLSTRERRVQNLGSSTSYGFGLRVLVDGSWGFAASPVVALAEVNRVAEDAVGQARQNRRIQLRPVELALEDVYPDAEWFMPMEIDPWDVPLDEKVDLLLATNEAAMGVAGVRFASSGLTFRKDHTLFASSEGSVIEQAVVRTQPSISVTAVSEDGSGVESRNSTEIPALTAGYEYVHEVDLPGSAVELAEEAVQKLSARPVEPGEWDLVLHPSHLFLTIHESIGHSTELDRALGHEANMAGTSFLAPPEEVLGEFRLGPEFMQVEADRTLPRGLASVGWDHDGVRTQSWPIIRDGVFVDYQTTRELAPYIAHLTGNERSHGTSLSQSWADVQFQRMPNINLLPGEEDLSIDDVISETDRGIYILGRGSYSIDHQRYNFQFGGQVYYEIRNGRIVGMLRDVAYQSQTPVFWNQLERVGGESSYHMGGTAGDGKGQPGQSAGVTHAAPVTRFRGIDVINTSEV